MALIPDCARIAHRLTCGAETMYVTHAVRYTTGVGAPDLGELATRAADSWEQYIRYWICSNVWWEEAVATDLGDPTAPVGVSDHARQAGQHGEAMSPLNTAAVVSLKTAKRGKSYQGRMYIPGIPRNKIGGTGQSWDGEFLTDFTERWGDYKDNMDPAVGDDGKLVVASAKLGTYEDVTSLVVRPYLGTQRRRLNATI